MSSNAAAQRDTIRVATRTLSLGHVEYTAHYFAGRLQATPYKLIAEVIAREPGFVTIEQDGMALTLAESSVRWLKVSHTPAGDV